MKEIKFTKENIALIIIIIISAILNFVNLGIEGYGNSYYASAVKSMTLSLKNFFFVSFDPAGFVTIDKPPLGFWLQAISAKIFGFSGVSILLPSALAGVISVILVHHLVKKSFGSIAGLLAALFLAITPVFVAVSRNNTIDNILILFLLLACWALLIAVEKGKFKYLIISMVFVGIGFNVKMLQAYLIGPALYITYLLSSTISIKKRIINLIVGTFVLLAVSLSWALVVDSIPSSSRPYVDSSTNNTVMELIIGHNGAERLSLSGSERGGAPGGRAISQNMRNLQNYQNGNRSGGGPFGGGGPSAGGPSGGPNAGGPNGGQGRSSSQLQGTFGGETTSGITRLFSKNILSDQIVWFIPLAIIGFIAASIREKLKLKLDNNRKRSLALWFIWFLPEFIYFSFNKGTFHSYYLTMLAPPIAALAGIGITTMWKLYKEGGWKAWLLPGALIVNGAVHLLMLYYFISSSNIIKVLIILVSILSIIPSLILSMLNIIDKKVQNNEVSQYENINLKKILVSLGVIGLIITPFTGSSAVLTNKLNGSFPAAGLELLSGNQQQGPKNSDFNANSGMQIAGGNSANTKLIEFLEKNKTASQKYLLVVSNSNSAADIIISTGEPVMSLGGFLGSDKIITLDQFKEMVKKGEIRYVMVGGMGGGNSSTDIMNWVKQNGKLVSESEYSNLTKDETTNATEVDKTTDSSAASNSSSVDPENKSSAKTTNDSNNRITNLSQQLYDLKPYSDDNNLY